MGKDLSTIVRDLPVEFDLEAARLGDYDRETVIRLFREYEFRTLIERLPAMTGETAGDAAEALRGVATDGSVPAARVAGSARPSGWGSADRSGRRSEGGGLQLSLDFDAVARAGARPRADAGDRATTGRPPVAASPDGPSRATCRPRWPRPSPTRRGSRSTRATGSPALEPWLAAQPAVGVGLLLDDPRPRRGTPIALALAGIDGRTIAVEGADDAATLRRLLDRLEHPGRRPRGQAAARRADRATTRTRDPTPVAFDTQIAAYVLNASLRSQTIADVVAEQLDLILPPVAELDGAARAGLEALAAHRRPRAARAPAREEGLDRLYAEIELPLIAVLARMEATGRRARPRGARPPRRGVRGRDLAARDRDLRRRRPRVQPRQPQAARAGPVLRAQPAEGQADEDRLLDRRVRARGPAPGPPDDRQAPRVARLHEAALDLRRCAADPDGRRRPPPHDVPPGRRRDRPAVVVRPEPPEHPDPDAARAADPAGVRRRRRRT